MSRSCSEQREGVRRVCIHTCMCGHMYMSCSSGGDDGGVHIHVAYLFVKSVENKM